MQTWLTRSAFRYRTRLRKPFTFVELLARIRVLTRRQDRVLTTTVIHGDLSIDFASHRVERSGMKLDLTARTTSLLAFLRQHVGEVLPKKEIHEKVWQDSFHGILDPQQPAQAESIGVTRTSHPSLHRQRLASSRRSTNEPFTSLRDPMHLNLQDSREHLSPALRAAIGEKFLQTCGLSQQSKARDL